MNKLTKWIKSHKPHTAGLSIAIVVVITFSVAGTTGVLSAKPADTASVEPAVTAEAPADTEKDADATAGESAEKAQAFTKTKAKTAVTKAPAKKSKKHASKKSKKRASKKTRVPKKGHWKKITKKVWVPKIVTIVDVPAWNEKVNDGVYYVTSDGHVFYDEEEFKAYDIKMIKAGTPISYSIHIKYKTIHHKARTHKEDRGHYKKKVVGKRWVVDRAGHYK